MKDREFVFRRKNDYKDDVIAWIKSLKKKHEDILFIPNTDCIKSSPVLSKIHLYSLVFVKSSLDSK